MITRMRTGDKEHIKRVRVHKFYCIGVRAGRGGDGVEGCVLRCTTVYFLLPEKRIT